MAKDWYADQAGELSCILRLIEAGECESDGCHEDEDLINERNGDLAIDCELLTSTDVVDDIDLTVSATSEPKHTDGATNDAISKRLRFTGGGSNKFWEITLQGNQHMVRVWKNWYERTGNKQVVH